MSNSERHREERLERAKQKAKENRMHRTAARKSVIMPVIEVPGVEVPGASRWRRFLFWLKTMFPWFT